ncbi:MAG: hypothetical protein HYY06_03220, partial [Deltaproteobacteria bacterium]|nr:hypothetical protein [Deltaproteobacteria bacterium]
RRLFWGHQSVGENLIQGSSALGYSWGEASRASDYDEGTTWGHGSIGENGDPEGKIRAFVSLMDDAGLADAVDAASFKFCWIDFEQGTNVAALLDDALAAVAGVEARHPDLRILLVTPPLTTDEPALNAMRWDYGRRMLDRASDDHVVFDLAAVISTDSRGQACTSGGARRLCDEWASDNGHLTEAGSERAAKAFLYAFSR